MTGRFITLEGTEGAGKSTNLDVLCAELSDAGIDFYQTREPGGTDLAEALRTLLLEPRQEPVDPLTELLMMFAARRQHIQVEIRPRLARGQWVVCDRFTDATFAYQGYARGVSLARIGELEQWVQESLQPDLTLYLDVDPSVGAARIADRDKDRLEREDEAFFQRVRKGYLERAAQHARFRVIDAAQDLDAVGDEIRRVVGAFLAAEG